MASGFGLQAVSRGLKTARLLPEVRSPKPVACSFHWNGNVSTEASRFVQFVTATVRSWLAGRFSDANCRLAGEFVVRSMPVTHSRRTLFGFLSSRRAMKAACRR